MRIIKGNSKSSFSKVIATFSAQILILLQDEVPNFKNSPAARLLMSVSFVRNSVNLVEVLWADDKSKPYKNIYGGCP